MWFTFPLLPTFRHPHTKVPWFMTSLYRAGSILTNSITIFKPNIIKGFIYYWKWHIAQRGMQRTTRTRTVRHTDQYERFTDHVTVTRVACITVTWRTFLRELEITHHGSRMHICAVLKNDYSASHIKQGRITHHQLMDSFFFKPMAEVASLVCVCVVSGKLCLIGCLRSCFGSPWRSYNVTLKDALIVTTFSFCSTLRAVPGCICWKLQYFVLWGCCLLSCVRRCGISS